MNTHRYAIVSMSAWTNTGCSSSPISHTASAAREASTQDADGCARKPQDVTPTVPSTGVSDGVYFIPCRIEFQPNVSGDSSFDSITEMRTPARRYLSRWIATLSVLSALWSAVGREKR